MWISPYLRLMRLHQPVGIWLLLWPCWWSVALASPGLPSPVLLLKFMIGAVLMRGAGCIVNDIADRKIDREVERTRARPLASGEITPRQAALFLLLLLALSLWIALSMGYAVVMWAVLSLVPIAIYPWMKRISWWPQLFLGFTFNWGALMGWSAVVGVVELPAIALYLGGIFWTLGYDTIYAHQDTKDDARIGIKSTALMFGKHTKRAVAIFYLLALQCWVLALLLTGASLEGFGLIWLAGFHLVWQIRTVNLASPESCRAIFTSNMYLGWPVFFALMLTR